MYTDWFKLKRLPFRLRPDPEFLYLNADTTPVFEALRAAVATGRGAMALIGEAGVGKTTLLHAIAQQRQGSMSVARIQQPNLTSSELLDALAEQFGLPTARDPAANPQTAIKHFIAEEVGNDRAVLILVDEAHRLASATLKELLKLCARQPAPLVILAGAPELATQLAALAGEPGAAGVALPPVSTLQLSRLDSAGTEGYVRRRLNVAGGGARDLFDADTFAELQRYTGGTPQLINEMCDVAMTLAETHNSPRVGITEIRDAAHELKWVEFSARAPAAAASTTPGPRREPLRAELDVQHRGIAVRRLPLTPGRITIGRGADCGLQLDSQFVSRHHCQIITTAEQSFVEDLGSTNGIVVNGRRRQLHKLAPHDQIVIGDHTLTYLETPEV
jgi:type II secretory pathway predicted ATPase ExeA